MFALFLVAAGLIALRLLRPPVPPNSAITNQPPIEILPEPSLPPSQISSLPTRRVAGITVNDQELEVEVATTSAEIIRGLSGRDSLDLDGMLFVFPAPGKQNFWMKDMRFSLDLVWINNGIVVDILRNVPVPEPGTPDSQLKTYFSPGSVTHVLELPAGAASRLGIEVSSDIITTDPKL
ncbi:MAG: DUF192 domain-containing protein [Parcubacteria group bacterium]|nr:DUF192 domain-containing protein [Parcubacteria group bacterium]